MCIRDRFETYGPLYDGFRNKNKLTRSFNALTMIHKLIFSFILVFLQMDHMLQVFLLILKNIFNCALIFLAKPYASPIDNTINIISEILFVVTGMLIGVYAVIDYIPLDATVESKVTLGWFICGIYTFMLTLNMIGVFAVEAGKVRTEYWPSIREAILGGRIEKKKQAYKGQRDRSKTMLELTLKDLDLGEQRIRAITEIDEPLDRAITRARTKGIELSSLKTEGNGD
eukprot:TRINITY_DN13782_c0_g1_i3.p1 TRINITY_DN13782_c0_g1~~TRINITY_DN13782_c0_g1_i3.p1  ORF type:complete len:248 (-),score=54.43 TRINITY_DN13782_c0_g1_i3:80-763(-)